MLRQTVRRLATSAVTLAVFSGSSFAQQNSGDINANGPCNANVTGSGNTVIVNCNPSGSVSGQSASDKFLVAINYNNEPAVQTWQRNQFGQYFPFYPPPGSINLASSNFVLEISDSRYDFYLSEQFEGDHLELVKGRHAYTMDIDLTYWSGASVSAVCKGVLDLRSAATLLPRFHVQVDPFSGQIAPINCGFFATQ